MKRPRFVGALALSSLASLVLHCAPNPSASPPAQAAPLAPAASAAPGACAPCEPILAAYVEATPAVGRDAGLHEYDGRLSDYTRASIERRIAAARRDLRALDALDARALSPDGALDRDLLRWSLREELFNLEERALWRTDPAYYSELFSVNDYADRDGASVAVRRERLLRHEEAALTQVRHVYENLALPLSKPVASVAAGIYAGYADYLLHTVPGLMLEGADPQTRARFDKTNGALAAEATRLATWLRTDVVPRGDDSHVLGAKRFEGLVALYAGAPIPLAEFKAMGEADLAKNRAAYDVLAASVKPHAIAEADYLQTATHLMEDARAFVIDRKIVTLPTEERVVARESPPYKRYNQAWIETFGAFETESRRSFFDITLPDASWSADERKGYLMPLGVLRVTAAHEVFPGHFVQIRWLDRAPTRAQKLLGSFTFHEGWAHYAEQMMIDEGFGGADPEARLGQLRDALLRDCRFVVALGIHTEGMSLADAEDTFVRRCDQDRATAHEQALRATFDPWYFAYTLGKLQILQLREEAKAKLGSAFSLQRFHDALLSHGMPPVALLRERVLAELDAPRAK